MDSFFSLFDPAEGNQNKQCNKKRQKLEQDNVKKKLDLPKGRRRGRKLQGKNESLPEESSFLCEPELSTDLLVKDGSYIENYIEVNKWEEDIKTDPDRKPKRRSSIRKNRRKKSKISPIKDLVPNTAWQKDTIDDNSTNWNNQSTIPKIYGENVGKNVNVLKITNNIKCEDLFEKGIIKSNVNSDDFDDKEINVIINEHIDENIKNKSKSDAKDKNMFQRPGYNVIDKLEKVSLKDDMYLAGDFNTEDLDNEFYSSDYVDESFDDTTTEPEDSGDEVYGSLPPEPRFGNVEYKLQLVTPCERRFQHLVTQLKWRLRSGGGSAVYVVGVRDCGALCGLRPRALRGSLYTLRRMASALTATLTHVTARRVAPHRAVAEVYIRKLADTEQSVELRVAVMGANEAGKSTLIGVLTQGELDNGRGSARLNMFRHLHEVKSGRTSSLSHEILGFDAQGNVVNYGCSELMTAERIGERSAKLVSFLDLAGHSKYQRTTLHGLTGYSPHYAMLVISATAGITRITEEHIGLLLALDLPFFTVISKCELAPTAVQSLVDRLTIILAPANKRPFLIHDENAARGCVAPQKLILDTIDIGTQTTDTKENNGAPVSCIPVFPVSCVRGVGLNALHAYLLAIQPPVTDHQHAPDDETCEFQVDEIFHMGESTGPVVGGLLARGQLFEGDDLIIGPLDTGEFVEISVKTIYRNRVPCGKVKAGQSASLGLSHFPPNLRPGMVLLTTPQDFKSGVIVNPTFGGCPPGKCKSKDQDIYMDERDKNHKNVRRKSQNLMKNLEEGLVKNIDNIEQSNIYKYDSNDKKEGYPENDVCSCKDKVLLENPNNPRGCMFFQASVRVLRHSTAIYPGFQCTVHVGNVRQTAVIQGIMSHNNVLRAGETASVVFRFARCPEYLVRGRRLLFTAGLGTRAIGRMTQTFPHVP